MRKIKYLLFLLLIFSISCYRSFDPRQYYRIWNKNKNVNVVTNDIDLEEDVIDPKLDPFKTGDWNRVDYNGFTINLDDYVMIASFGEKNKPTYKLEYRPNTWKSKDLSLNEYYYEGANTSGGGVTMTGVVYYMYKGKNPAFSSTSSYNKSSRLTRFYFYRITATPANQNLDNYLIVIDSYSKLVYGFGIPTSWSEIVGIPTPTSWGPVELGWEADTATGNRINFGVDGLKYFYEYDPVGILNKDGTITIYQWCIDSIAQNRYAPRFNGKIEDTKRAIATYGKDGRSPYMPLVIADKVEDKISVSLKSIKNINLRSKEFKLFGNPTLKDSAWLTYSIGATVYDNDIVKPVENIVDLDPQPIPILGMGIDKTKSIDVNSIVSFNESREFVVNNIDSVGGFIELSSRIDKYNKNKFGQADTGDFGKNGSGRISSKDAPKIKMKYDINSKTFIIDGSSINSTEDTDIEYDTSFSIKRGETKEFVIKYIWKKGNEAKEELEITYSIEFKNR